MLVNCQDAKQSQVVHEKDEIKKNMRDFVNQWQIDRKTMFEKEKQKSNKLLPKCVQPNGEIATVGNQDQKNETQQQPQEIDSSEKISKNVTNKNTTQIVPPQKQRVKLRKKITRNTITLDKNQSESKTDHSYNTKIKSKKAREMEKIRKDLDEISERSLKNTEKQFEKVKKKIDKEAEETMKATQKQVKEIQDEVDNVAHSSTTQIGKIKQKIISMDEQDMNNKLKTTLAEHESLEFDHTPFEKYGQFLTKSQARDATHEVMDSWDVALTEEQESIFDKDRFDAAWEQLSNDEGKIEAAQSRELIESLLK